jgi:excisionase family DNA binding protein
MASAATVEFMTVEECAARFRVTSRTIRRWVFERRLPRPVRIGRRLLIPSAMLPRSRKIELQK